ncbi:hypothetical protein EDEG_01725 [Edhazardia aedis USNM 41457]|uniref:Transmembrane protein n=1 Tax=Edhazardia aedis (strain USNM 41457) TaxID=1003232 RepID=J9DRP1_EDHAE|nr:hypothetical protein EDEG_01725 [Edhazardia aedis USNM 41457]|eukprot:EJW03992.1 hypothetical protein EDEG_01725 [Edhazardia aedis USNM 41457]
MRLSTFLILSSTVFIIILITILNVLISSRIPWENPSLNKPESKERKIQQINDAVFLPKDSSLHTCSAFNRYELKMSESFLREPFDALIHKIIEPIKCSNYTGIYNETGCVKCDESREYCSNCSEIYFQCFSSLKLDRLNSKELENVYETEYVPLDVVCDELICYEEYINPSISFSSLKCCFSDCKQPSHQQKMILGTNQQLFYNLRYTNKRIQITTFAKLYQRKIVVQFKKQYAKHNNESDDNKNSSFKLLSNKRFDLWKKAVAEESDKIKNKNTTEILSNISIDYFKKSKNVWFEFSDFIKIKEAFQSYFFDSCKIMVGKNKSTISDATEYCCEQTAKHLAIAQFNFLTYSKFIENNQNTYQHCTNLSDAKMIEFRFSNLSSNSYYEDYCQEFFDDDSFYKYGLKKTNRNPETWSNLEGFKNVNSDSYSIQKVGTCEMNAK